MTVMFKSGFEIALIVPSGSNMRIITHFDGPEDLIGTIVDVKIEEAGRNSLVGVLAT